ncbi:MAG: leucine-rich repeat domain-containing protein [Acholeplasmatales bacterium]|nr:leucine-rich repeat domain-containing protein [Acholeplasmatales bacterium]
MVEYEIRGNMVVITGCSKDEMNLDLPDEIEDKPVGKIEANTFNNMLNIKRVVIPGTCKVVGAYAFAACSSLEELIIEEGVETIEDWAFISCNITSIRLPQSLRSVGNNAFLGNQIKSDVDEFMEKMSSMRRPKNHTNNKCFVFPIEMLKAKDKIKDDFIQSESKYVDSQFDKVDIENSITQQEMDIPFLYDGQEFVIAVYNRKPLESLKVELASESNTSIGLYAENDPEFLILRANILTKGQFITSFAFKAPYLEAVEFQCLGIESHQSEGMYYYFLHMKAELSCFGNGNLNNEFALNQYNDLLFKFRTKYANQKLNDEQNQFIENAFAEKILITMEGFLTQLDGSPRLLYLMNIFKALLEDPNLDSEKQNKISELYSNFLMTSYNDLTGIESLTKIAFDDIDNIIVEIEEIMQLGHYNIAEKYDIQLTDSVGNPIDINDAKNMKSNFINLEQNYKLHGDYLYYIYNESRQMNQDFSMMQYESYKPAEEEVN